MKKNIKFALLLTPLVVLSACKTNTNVETSSNVVLTTTTTARNTDLDNIINVNKVKRDLYIMDEDPRASIDIFYFNDNNVSYIEISEFFKVLDLVYEDVALDSNATFTIDKSIDNQVKVTRENLSYVIFDASKNDITISDSNQFCNSSFSNPLCFLPDYGDLGIAGVDTDIKFVANSSKKQNEYTGGEEVNFDFDDYNIKTIVYDNNLCLPFTTLSDIFLTTFYSPMTVFDNAIYSPELDGYPSEIYYNGKVILTSEVIDYHYNELAFNLDFNYGLDIRREELLEEYNCNKLSEVFRKTLIKRDNLFDLDVDLTNLGSNLIDDIHSYILTYTPMLSFDEKMAMYSNEVYGKRNDAYYKEYSDVKGNSNIPRGYNEYEDTAIISFTRFDELDDELYNVDDLNGDTKDAGELFAYAYKRITRTNSPIKNIVIDITLNGGGDTRCGTFIAGMFSDCAVAYTENGSLNGSGIGTSYYESDCNLDGVIDENDKLISGGDFNIYCLTSSVSFSCANLLPHMLRDSNPEIKIIGHQSAGGECCVLPCTSVYGTLYTISGYSAARMKDSNNELVTTDLGVPVDYEFDGYDYLNLNNVLKYIHEK